MLATTVPVYAPWGRLICLVAMLSLFSFVSTQAESGAPDRWQALIDAGAVAREQARYADAERLFLLAGHEASTIDSTDVRIAATLNHLGLVYHAQGQYARAKPYYEQALARWEQALGSESADVASALNNLAEVSLEEHDLEQAERYYLRSIAIGERMLGAGHPELAVAYNNLAGLYRKQGRAAQAEAKFRLALAILQGTRGAASVDPAPILNNLAALYKEQGLYVYAEPLYRQALALRRAQFGPRHPAIAIGLNNLANLCHAQGLAEDADRYYRDALAVSEETAGPEAALTDSRKLGLADPRTRAPRRSPTPVPAGAGDSATGPGEKPSGGGHAPGRVCRVVAGSWAGSGGPARGCARRGYSRQAACVIPRGSADAAECNDSGGATLAWARHGRLGSPMPSGCSIAVSVASVSVCR
jgi:tetratricopeptide (TPR) repeat protein